MTQTELRRECLTVSNWEPETITLAEEAERVLSYSALKNEQQQQAEEKPLASMLSKLQIEVLNADDVAAYQKERCREQAEADFREWLAKGETQSAFISQTWNQTKIEEYKRPVPEFVLNKAIQIKREMPNVLIFIEELKRDPFLVVSTPHAQYSFMRDEEYRVEVWEEPKFEGRIR